MDNITKKQAVAAAKLLKQWGEEHPRCECCNFCPCQGVYAATFPDQWEIEEGESDEL